MKNISNEELYKECHDFLEKAYFSKSEEDEYTRASNRAYLDFCRTFHTDMNTEKLRMEAAGILKRNIEEILDEKIINQEIFDNWHRNLCEKLKDLSKDLSYGHVQKWVNMTLKYLLVLDNEKYVNIIDFMHIPIDNIVINKAGKVFGIPKNVYPWSKIDNYEVYINYQKQLRLDIINKTGLVPICWELKIWGNVK